MLFICIRSKSNRFFFYIAFVCIHQGLREFLYIASADLFNNYDLYRRTTFNQTKMSLCHFIRQ